MRRFLATLIILGLSDCSRPPRWQPIAPEPPSDWPVVATVGGAAVHRLDDESEWIAILNRLVQENVSVVEADSSLSEYLSDEEFEAELAMMRRFAQLAHERNLKVVWYYPSLEVITPNGETAPHSMFKDHPDWVQLGLDEEDPTQFKPNVFYGSKVFWVDPGAESAWMCHLSPYRDYLFERIRKVATTGVDGLWLDVPLFNDIVGKWACYHERDQAKFRADTGYEIPRLKEPGTNLDASDPAWRVWVRWRHLEIDQFLRDALAAARSVNPDFQMVVETVTMDYNAALLEGLDGAFAGPDAGYWHVWEVDALSDTNAMVHANEDDWASLIAMFKFGRGADRGRAAWAFTYGYEPDDAEAVLAEALAAQVCPYELKIPEMTTTVGHEYRKRVFGWIRRHEDDLFRSVSAARVALVHSSASRDYRDGPCVLGQGPPDNEHCGVSLFATWNRPDPNIAWWTSDEDDSLYRSMYLGEYRGFVKALVRLHTPFDVIPSLRLPTEALSRYELIVVPDPLALSDDEASALRGYVERGGHLLITGSEAGTLDERGLQRPSSILAPILPDPVGGEASAKCRDRAVAAGRVRLCETPLGRAFLNSSDPEALALIRDTVETLAMPLIRIEEGVRVHVEMYRRGARRILHVVNLSGVDGTFSVEPVSFQVEVVLAPGESVSRVVASSARQQRDEPIAWTQDGDSIFFPATVSIHSLFLIE